MQRLHESQGPYYPVKEILDESETRYKIWWDGIDPDTKRPWKIDWVRETGRQLSCISSR